MIENGPSVNRLAGNHLVQVGIVEQSMLFELALDVGQRELGSVDRNIQLGENPGQTADVVFVPMGQKDRANLVAVFSQVTDVGNNNVHTQQLFFRKHQTGIDDNNVILPAESHAVHAELAQAPQRNHLQFILCHQPSILASHPEWAAARQSHLGPRSNGTAGRKVQFQYRLRTLTVQLRSYFDASASR